MDRLTPSHLEPAERPQVQLGTLIELAWVPGYAVDAEGGLWTRRLRGGKRLLSHWRRLSPVPDPKGYLTFTFSIGNRKRTIKIHRLIAETFHGPRPPGHQCRHLDGNKTNNRADNLRWGTAQENMDDQITHGVIPLGERCHSSVLTRDQVIEIKQLLRAGGLQRTQIAKRFGVARETVVNIARGETWAWLELEAH